MDSIRLMNRIDTKYVISVNELKELLLRAKDDYRAQEINGKRVASYRTVYYDTQDHSMYLMHHNGRKPRTKVRFRTYLDSGISFFELKRKNNHGRTRKKRIEVASMDSISNDNAQDFLADNNAGVTLDQLTPHLENQFRRITLVNNAKTERITIDTNIHFHNFTNNVDDDITGLAIVEVKRDGRSISPMHDLLIRMHVHPQGFSKYCMGCAITDATLKQNNFKQRLRKAFALMGRTYKN